MVRRTILIAIASLALITNAFGCNDAWITSAPAKMCCALEKCSPASRIDSGCKATPAGSTQDLESQTKVSVAVSTATAQSVFQNFVVPPLTLAHSPLTDSHPPPDDAPDLPLPLRI